MEPDRFDLYIGICNNPMFNLDSFVNKLKESKVGKYVTVKTHATDGSSMVQRNLFPGSVEFVAYIAAGNDEEPYCHWHTGFTRINVNAKCLDIGVCVLSKNINADIKNTTWITEDTLLNSIINAFDFVVDICKKMEYNITGDELGVFDYK